MLKRRRKGERGGAPGGGGPETQACGRKIPVPPNLSSARGQIGPARRVGEGKAPTLRSRQDQGPERTTCLCLSPESSRVCPTRGGREAPETFPHAFPLSPSPSPLPSPLLPSAPQQQARLGTRGGRRRRQGGGSYLPGKFPAPRRGYPPPGPGLGARPAQRSAAASPPAPKAAAAPAAATAKAALRPVPPPRTAHTGASLAARIPALARVPEGTFLSRARPGRASRVPSRPGLRRLPEPVGRGGRTFCRDPSFAQGP
ncbi:translation initiation factor IF-2-like [Cervus canadensis]|uniref:translation initiation factor IF-2-like n=1 Tax=Cervus canadensis TaxID=1574408 RepID=UPI001C9E7B1C|nr:translation initiation factor IF-2-like [Cervus canadensis]